MIRCLILDTNVLFSFFGKTSTRELIYELYEMGVNMYTPRFARDELEKLRDIIKKKAKINDSEFELIITHMFSMITEVPLIIYADKVEEAKKISPDPDDVDFVALALKYNCKIWTLDKALLSEDRIPTIATGDILSMLQEAQGNA